MFNAQSLLGRKALEVQLQRIGIFDSTNTFAEFKDFEGKVKFCKISFISVCTKPLQLTKFFSAQEAIDIRGPLFRHTVFCFLCFISSFLYFVYYSV